MGIFLVRRDEIAIVALLLLSSFLLRVLLFPVPGYEVDLNLYSYWFRNAAEHGTWTFYDVVWCDYPPLNVYIFWTFGSLARQLSVLETASLVYIVKMPSTLFDIGISLFIFLHLRRRLDFRTSVIFMSLYAFNPATIYNGAVWGQFDAIYTFFLLLSLILLLDFKAPEFSAVAFTLGVLTKPQSIALFPLLAFLILKVYGWRKAFNSALISAFTVLLVILPFRWSHPVEFLTSVYFKGYGYYSYNSINAFNLWALMGFWKPDTQPFPFLNLNIIGWVMFGALAVFLLHHLNRRFRALGEPEILFCAFLLLFGFFMLPTRIHERYLFPAFSVLVLVLPFDGGARWIYGTLTFTYLFNQAYVVDFLNRGEFIPDGDILACTIAVINICAFVYSLSLLLGKRTEILYPLRPIPFKRKARRRSLSRNSKT